MTFLDLIFKVIRLLFTEMYVQFMAILNLKSPVYHPMYGAFLLFSFANKSFD